MSRLDRVAVEAIYRDGVDSIVALTAHLSDDDWAAPACGDWDRADTARHLVAVADWYHEWLDRALVGDSSPPFSEEEFDHRNAQRVSALSNLSGPTAVVRFAERAEAYLDRAVPEWDTPFGFPFGAVTVGVHLGVAATEWHLHVWDLSAGELERHQPAAPQDVFVAAGIGMARARGGIRGRLLELLVPVAAKRSPWDTLLQRSGRP